MNEDLKELQPCSKFEVEEVVTQVTVQEELANNDREEPLPAVEERHHKRASSLEHVPDRLSPW